MKEMSNRTQIGYASMHGFITGTRSMTMRNAAKLAILLGMELRPVGRTKRKDRVAR